MLDVAGLQRRLGVAPDGAAGPATMRALFSRFGAAGAVLEELSLAAPVHFADSGIMANGLRLAHAMSQFAHESGGFRYMEEIASGQAYEGRADLGNTQAGDGRRYKGRGPIQITGRANYGRYGRMLGIDLERRPELASAPSIGLMIGCAFWVDRGLNAFADRDDLEALTRRINGGTNGLADRRARLVAAKKLVLG